MIVSYDEKEGFRMTEKRFYLLYSQLGSGMFVDREEKIKSIIVDKEFQKIGLLETLDLLNELADENEQLKHQNELLSDELEQCKAVIDKRWSEYLKKKELQE